MILRPRSRFANRNANLEAPADTNGDNVYELTAAASDGSLSDTQALSAPENQGAGREGVTASLALGGRARQPAPLPEPR